MKSLAVLLAFLAACGDDTTTPGPDAGPAPCTPTAGAAAERVTTTGGVVHGARDGETWAYKGVPFVAPPVGDLRLRSPEPVACAAAEIDATAFGPSCPQIQDGAYSGVEDCLQLNVWAPATASAARPVMVWIHGGGNSVGTAVKPLFDGRRLAETGDVLVVTVNYRLAQLGFLTVPGLDSGAGNYGTLDQIAALAWVRDNIAAFGGDPNNVTIFGESAGARDVCTLLAAKPAAGLFHRAIMESGACKFLPTRTTAETTGAMVAAAAGCGGVPDVPACLRALPAETLIRALPGDPGALGSSPYQSTIDGTVLTEQPSAALAAGRHHAVPFIVGANAAETGAVAPMVTTEAAYQDLIHAQYGTTLGDRVLAQYPASRFPTPRAAFVRATTDGRFLCPSREIARAADAGQTPPVYRYLFSYAAASPFGAVHGLEIPFVFGTFSGVETPSGQGYTPTPADLAVSAAMQHAWTTFARTGVPETTPAWPAWTPADTALVFDAAPSAVTGIRTEDCDFWRPIYDSL